MSSRNPGFNPGYPGSHGNKNILIGSRVSFAIAQDPGMTIFTQYALHNTQYEYHEHTATSSKT